MTKHRCGNIHIRYVPVLVFAVLLCFPATGFPAAGVGQVGVERVYGTGVNQWVGPPSALRFRWSTCFTCDFYQVRWAKEGTPEVQQRQAKSAPHWIIGNLTPGATYIFKVQACESGVFGSSCSGWSDARAVVPAPPTNVQASDESYWNDRDPMEYVGKLKFTWRPAVAVVGLRLGREGYLPAATTSWETVGVKPGESVNVLLCAYIHEWDDTQKKRIEVSVGCTSLSGQVALPHPKVPARVRVDMPSTNVVRLYWLGDNVTDSFEIERLQRSNRLATVEGSPIGRSSVPRAPAKEERSGLSSKLGGTVTQQPPTGAAAGLQPSGPAAPPYWVRVKTLKRQADYSTSYFIVDDVDRAATKLVGTAVYEPYTYRVCAVNKTGRACSEAVRVPSGLSAALGAGAKSSAPVGLGAAGGAAGDSKGVGGGGSQQRQQLLLDPPLEAGKLGK